MKFLSSIILCLGPTLNVPSKFLICYAKVDKHGTLVGGTRTAWECAKQNNIPCFNLFFEEDRERIMEFIGEK